MCSLAISSSKSSLIPSSPSPPPIIKRNDERLDDLEARFNQTLIGQKAAVHEVCQMLKCIVTGFYDKNRPYGVLLFAGPTGVGKTELAKMIAKELSVQFIRYDMSEFGEAHTVSSLLGSPPGYLGSNEEGRLIRDLKENPVSVVLFDEIEKAHRAVFRIFLQLFDEGHLADRTGHSVSVRTTIFILTTNLGSQLIQKTPHPSSDARLIKTMEQLFIRTFTPELHNRIHRIIIFNPISQEAVCEITRLYMQSLAADILETKKIVLRWTPGAIQYFVKSNSSLHRGARGIQRCIANTVFPLLSDFCRIRKIGPGDAIRLKTAQQGILLKVGIIFRKKQQLRDSAARVIRIDTFGGPLKNLIGKYATRPTPPEGDNAFSNWPYKIISISNEGIVLKNPVTRLLFHLDPSWDDNQWTLTPPNTSAKHFLLNLCKEISDSGKRRTTRQLIKKLYSQIDESCGSQLVNTDLWAELTQYVATKSNAKELIEIIEQLKKLMGSLFIEWPHSPSSDKIYSSAHYDFPQSKDTSKKRKSPSI